MRGQGTTSSLANRQMFPACSGGKFGEERIADAIERLRTAVTSCRILCAASDTNPAMERWVEDFQVREGLPARTSLLQFAGKEHDMNHLVEIAAFEGAPFVRAKRNRSGLFGRNLA